MVNTSEGRPPQHQTQMNLFNAIATAAVIGTSLIAVTPAKANTWCGPNRNGAEICVTTFGNRQAKIIVDDEFNNTGYIMFVNCNSGSWRVRANTGYSRSDLNHETIKACSVI